MKLWHARWQGKRLRKSGFLSVEELQDFCQRHSIDRSELEIYEEERPEPESEPESQRSAPLDAENASEPSGPPPYGCWLKWPGMFLTDGQGTELAFPSVEDARAWMQDEGYLPGPLLIRSLNDRSELR